MSVMPFASKASSCSVHLVDRHQHNVYRTGRRSAVIVIHEMPGITPLSPHLAARLLSEE